MTGGDSTQPLEVIRQANDRISQDWDMDLVDASQLYQEARAVGWKALERYPTHREIYRELHELERAYRSLRTLKVVQSGAPFDIATVDSHFWRETRSLYEKAVSCNPNWAGAHYLLADREGSEGQCKEAHRHLLQGIARGDVADEVESCVYGYLVQSDLAPLSDMPSGGICQLDHNLPARQAMPLIQQQWQALEPLLPRVQQLGLEKVFSRCLLTELSFERLQVVWPEIERIVPDEYLDQLQYRHLIPMALQTLWGKGYRQPEVAEVIGLEQAWMDGDTLQRLQYDDLCQQLFFSTKVNNQIVTLETRLLKTAEPDLRQALYQSLLTVGDFDGAVGAILEEFKALREAVREASRAYDAAWADYPTVDDRLNLMRDINNDWTPDMEVRRTLNQLEAATRDQLYAFHWHLQMVDSDLLVIDLVRRIGGIDQPWLGRFLVRQPSLQGWLNDADLLESFSENQRFLEVDKWLEQRVSHDSRWREVGRILERTTETLSERLTAPVRSHPFPDPARMLGQHVWEWLDNESQLFVETAESRHRREVWLGERVPDYTGIYLLYQKALERTVKKGLLSALRAVYQWSEDHEETFGNYPQKLRGKKVQSHLPEVARPWATELADRIDAVRDLRNPSAHGDVSLDYEDYMHLRHLVLGTRYEERRTTSMFWLIYALYHILTGESIS